MPKNLLNIGFNLGRTFITPLVIFVVSYLAIELNSKEFWGGFVPFMFLVNIVSIFTQFGGKEYLVRSFSKAPSEIRSKFYTNLFSRFVLFVPLAFLVVIIFQTENQWWICLWILGLFFNQSADSLIIYHKKFKVHFFIELITSFLLIVPFLLGYVQKIETIILLFASSTFIKSLLLILFVYPKPSKFKFEFKEISLTIPFLLIGLSGLLQSRVDQYIIALFAEKEVIASYQIFLSAFILLQAFGGIIISTYSKSLYRINVETFKKFQLKIIKTCLPLVLVFGTIFSLLLWFLYDIKIEYWFYLSGILFVIPTFIYVPIIFLFYRQKKEKEVMFVNYIGAIFNLVLTFIFVAQGKPFNAMIASMIAQWGILAWYLLRKKKLINEIELSRMSE